MSTLRPGWLVAQLPRVLSEDDLVVRFVGALEEMAAEARAPLDAIDVLVDVDLAPAPFVRWLGSWIGVPVEEGLPQRRQREVVRVAGRQFPWRGTRRGLRELIEAYTGHPVRVEDSGGVVSLAEADTAGVDRTVTIHIRGAGGIDEHHLLRLVEQEIPADATAELRSEDHTVEAEAAPGQLMETGEEAVEGEAEIAEGPGPMAPRARATPAAASPEAEPSGAADVEGEGAQQPGEPDQSDQRGQATRPEQPGRPPPPPAPPEPQGGEASSHGDRPGEEADGGHEPPPSPPT